MSEEITFQSLQMMIAGFKGAAGIAWQSIILGHLAKFCQKVSCGIMLVFGDFDFLLRFFKASFQDEREEVRLLFDQVFQELFSEASVKIIDCEKQFPVLSASITSG